MSRYQVVLFDFDGVLCHDRFYANLRVDYPEVHEFIESQVFGSGSPIPNRWMRGELTSDDVNRFISEHTGIEFPTLSTLFVESVAQMRIDARLLDLAARLRADGVAVGLVTGNMDVFNRVTVERHRLRDVFQAIVNSCDYGCLKDEEGGRLFDVAMAMLGMEGQYTQALLVDDSLKSRATFLQKGGTVFLYREYGAFKEWVDANLNLSTPAPAP